MKPRINHKLQCEVDIRRDDCKREPAHCHIVWNGVRVAQVWLNPVEIKYGHSLDHNEVKLVLDFVRLHKYELEAEYRRNAGD